MRAGVVGSGARAEAAAASRAQTLVAAFAVALLGGFLVWAVGFSPIAALHNAAHDTRHSMAFPCH
ncbi:MAG TPA: CbtB-domain containing protein [Stellaceae bacterium]|nr:CbtB-domain containing protein [Stellaceae bacterium]